MKLVPVAAAVLLTACASAPPERHHTLLAPSMDPAPVAAVQRWQLLPVAVPAQVDRPQWVVRVSDGSLAVLEQERWIAPLGDEVGAALTDALVRRLGPPTLSADAYRLRVDVMRFESLLGQAARLEVVWAIQPPGAPGVTCARTIERPVAGGYVALAGAHRAALLQLAQELADAIQASAGGRAAGCVR